MASTRLLSTITSVALVVIGGVALDMVHYLTGAELRLDLDAIQEDYLAWVESIGG